MRKLFFKRKGQGMTEYILIIALIALAAFASIKMFGGKIDAKFSELSNALTS